jgi:ATP-binding cassette subfamily B protein
MNYDSVKAFGNENLEINRYDKILHNLEKQANIVQTSLSRLNIGQSIILSTGLTINLLMAAHGVHAGTLTPGDFVMI